MTGLGETEVIWYGKKLEAAVRAHLTAGMKRAGMMLENEVKQLISRGPGASAPSGSSWETRMKIHRQGAPRGPRSTQHSKPGEPPFLQTGTLRANITFEIDDARSKAPLLKVGVRRGVPYAKALEYGNRRIKKRPFLRPTIIRHRSEAFRLIAAGAK